MFAKGDSKIATSFFSQNLLSLSFLLARPWGPVIAEVLADAQSNPDVFSA